MTQTSSGKTQGSLNIINVKNTLKACSIRVKQGVWLTEQCNLPFQGVWLTEQCNLPFLSVWLTEQCNRRKKGSTYKQRGICNPPSKGKAYSFAADCKSAESK